MTLTNLELDVIEHLDFNPGCILFREADCPHEAEWIVYRRICCPDIRVPYRYVYACQTHLEVLISMMDRTAECHFCKLRATLRDFFYHYERI